MVNSPLGSSKHSQIRKVRWTVEIEFFRLFLQASRAMVPIPGHKLAISTLQSQVSDNVKFLEVCRLLRL